MAGRGWCVVVDVLIVRDGRELPVSRLEAGDWISSKWWDCERRVLVLEVGVRWARDAEAVNE
jgi:hypothetical protein